MSKGKFGIHGGQFVPETLMNAVNEFEEAYEKYKNDPESVSYTHLLRYIQCLQVNCLVS